METNQICAIDNNTKHDMKGTTFTHMLGPCVSMLAESAPPTSILTISKDAV
jgi:hypothetical protein